ncbi:16S rRNA (uracil(1498)-N(3))-methyltransferase [Glaciecola siphonariae]|uniref:Ribosomal RNA small subunit methyltransferase E n=1 Tax=Glaciecola siphonariae TaxID=521012 RepID=A0ABV9LWU3_9ALTE
MRIPRFFADQPLQADAEITLDSTLSHYIVTVLRLKEGAPLILFNGDGADYPSQIVHGHKKHTSVLVDAQISLHVESPLSLHLAQGVSKGDRMDFALQKSVELGVTEITPVITEYCNVKLSEERWLKKHEQWQKIIISACEQCQRNRLPVLHPTLSFSQFVGQQSKKKKLILAPGSESYLSGVGREPNGYILLVGPEGGFSEQEVYTASQVAYTPVNLGPRILRTETAALASISILQATHGDL